MDRDIIIHGSLVKRLRRRPLTAETRVRFPYGLLLKTSDDSDVFFTYIKSPGVYNIYIGTFII